MSGPTTAAPALTLHHLNNSRSQRILWLLEELELPYEIKKYQRTAQGLAPPELLAINPLGKSPVISDGDVVLAESGAIVEYLIAKYGKGQFDPPETGRLDNLYFTHYAEGSLQPILVRRLLFRTIPKNSPTLLRPLLNTVFQKLDKTLNGAELERHGKLIETHLEKSGDWIAGGSHPTSADFLMSFCLDTFISRGPEYLGPKSREYVKRIQERPAYKRALEKGGKYDYALNQ
ncbi:hypothetical protein AX16_004352 [Volvariella volvacea WC 439]|nr:hypothetical protein AX16_004352 [Volvariella volvacea WC 439]